LTLSPPQIFEKLKGKLDPSEQEKQEKAFQARLQAQWAKQMQRDADVVSLDTSLGSDGIVDSFRSTTTAPFR
jgi:hypothetical protein